MSKASKDKKDPISASEVYRIPCIFGSIYLETTKRSINIRDKTKNQLKTKPY